MLDHADLVVGLFHLELSAKKFLNIALSANKFLNHFSPISNFAEISTSSLCQEEVKFCQVVLEGSSRPARRRTVGRAASRRRAFRGSAGATR